MGSTVLSDSTDEHPWRWGVVHTVTWRHLLSEHGPEAQRAAAGLVFDVGPFPMDPIGGGDMEGVTRIVPSLDS